MEMNRLDEFITVASQIAVADIDAIVAAGYRAIICNRPDGEGEDQATFGEIEAAATAHGLAAVYLPVVSGEVTDEDSHKFRQLLQQLPGPVLAYCRSGKRSTTLWTLSQAN